MILICFIFQTKQFSTNQMYINLYLFKFNKTTDKSKDHSNRIIPPL